MADDFAANTSTTGVVGAPGSSFAFGNIETANDHDWFKVKLSSDHSYVIHVRGAASNSGTVLDAFLNLRDLNGNLIASNDDSGIGADSELSVVHLNTTGTYFIDVSALGLGATGTYLVQIEDLSSNFARF